MIATVMVSRPAVSSRAGSQSLGRTGVLDVKQGRRERVPRRISSERGDPELHCRYAIAGEPRATWYDHEPYLLHPGRTNGTGEVSKASCVRFAEFVCNGDAPPQDRVIGVSGAAAR